MLCIRLFCSLDENFIYSPNVTNLNLLKSGTLDPIEMLDILGNENRRRILQLLSFRPFYFNEMVKRLDVGPKAVINHLDMLERAGLVECYQDNRRRKYFRIAKNVILEVAVSPHTYGVRTYRVNCVVQKSAESSSNNDYPTNNKVQQLSNDAPLQNGISNNDDFNSKCDSDNGPKLLEELRLKLSNLEEKQVQMKHLLQDMESKKMEIQHLAAVLIEERAENQLEAELIAALVSGRSSTEILANRLRMPEAVVEDGLRRLAVRGNVHEKDGEWTI